MRIRCARHGERAAPILEQIVRLVFDCSACLLWRERLGEAAALNHEAVNHTMKDGAVVEAIAHVAQEVFGRFRCIQCIDFDRDIAEVRHQFHVLGVGNGAGQKQTCEH